MLGCLMPESFICLVKRGYMAASTICSNIERSLVDALMAVRSGEIPRIQKATSWPITHSATQWSRRLQQNTALPAAPSVVEE